MGITSLQVCMDSSDWFQQGTITEENAGGILMDDCSPMITTPSGEGEGEGEGEDNILSTCSRPLIESRRLRPQHEQSLKCPRCESTHTKFCYYNNYSLSQPRYFCKTCRRYWTKGGTLRNIPVGGGCRKNKKVSSSSSKKVPPPSSSSSPPSSSSSPAMILNHQHHNHHHAAATSALLSSYNMMNNPNHQIGSSSDHYSSTAGLHLAFSDQLQFSSLGFFNNNNNNNNNNSNSFLLDQTPPAPIDFMENKYGNLVGDFVGNNVEDFCGMNDNVNFHGVPFGGASSSSLHGNGNSGGGPVTILESCQRLMMPYDNNHLDHQDHAVDVKPSSSKILSLEWHDHHQQVGYNFGGLGSWTGLMNGYGSSSTNPLV